MGLGGRVKLRHRCQRRKGLRLVSSLPGFGVLPPSPGCLGAAGLQQQQQQPPPP